MSSDPAKTPFASLNKTMSLTPSEFELSLNRVAPQHIVELAGSRYRVNLDDDAVAIIELTKLPNATLGGLIKMPRTQVVLSFENATETQQSAFLSRFNQAFQRGGG